MMATHCELSNGAVVTVSALSHACHDPGRGGVALRRNFLLHAVPTGSASRLLASVSESAATRAFRQHVRI